MFSVAPKEHQAYISFTFGGRMSSVHIANTGQRIEIDLATSLLVALQLHQIPIETVCGGRAKCGRCLVRVLEGEQYLTRKNASEQMRLSALEAGPDMRLACQTHTRGDISIRIINLKEP
jgi:ferredoxin